MDFFSSKDKDINELINKDIELRANSNAVNAN
jgi:hypothetical protein